MHEQKKPSLIGGKAWFVTMTLGFLVGALIYSNIGADNWFQGGIRGLVVVFLVLSTYTIAGIYFPSKEK